MGTNVSCYVAKMAVIEHANSTLHFRTHALKILSVSAHVCDLGNTSAFRLILALRTIRNVVLLNDKKDILKGTKI